MKFKKLNLYTNKLEEELEFYSNILGFECSKQSNDRFSVRLGWSELSFTRTNQAYNYHYCFLIPANKLSEALDWVGKRTEILEIENGRKVQNFATWNADSFYFYDGSGNLAECIVRYDLKNDCNSDFTISQFLCINEIGMPTSNVERLNSQLEDELQTKFWKGDVTRFGTNGNQEGLFLLPNYKEKESWFPTSLSIKANPFEATIENGKKEYGVEFKNEELSNTSISL